MSKNFLLTLGDRQVLTVALDYLRANLDDAIDDLRTANEENLDPRVDALTEANIDALYMALGGSMSE